MPVYIKVSLQRSTKCTIRGHGTYNIRRNGGKLFQMSVPQIANARRPKSVRVRSIVLHTFSEAVVDTDRTARM